ncbi:type IV secretory system conjugative DNA transfer family protein [Streptantibioticus rubrisoli]|uniref:TraM recognition domain-containing protein n=1 Tax=Streptantibioticus rubrisoli TaxID=1387313 RepID=A0ABT1PML9_9ACTN|nr:type IV secretory system conjugative DNA transfer family protein [Streptantibioticus rubrisoli]MCQ4045813.1 TraM recognition domain-containing protein [Streptantibioticus rubrisoli]
MNDNSKGSETNPTTADHLFDDAAVLTTSARQEVNDNALATPTPGGARWVWDPAVTSAPLSRIERQLLGRPTARYAALGAVPATFLAADQTGLNTPSFGKVLGSIAHIAGHLFAQQPLLVSAIVVAGLGAGYLKLKEDTLLGGIGIGGRETDGFATARKIRKRVSRRAVVKQRGTLRPSLADVPARQVDTSEVAVRLGKDRKTHIDVWSPIEDSTAVIAPMGAGKTGLIGNFVVDAPGSVLATSTKVDIVRLTAPLRARLGGRIWTFNPQDLGDGKFSSTLLWDPVIGCRDPKVALRRAKYLLDGSDITSGLENRDFWNSQSFKVLKSFLWAADMKGLTLLDVARWAKKPLETPATAIFEEFADVAPLGWADDLQQTQAPAQKDSRSKTTTLDNVFLTLSTTFECLSLPEIAQSIVDAHREDVPQFDVESFITSGSDTVYILGEDTGTGGIGPLFTTLTGEIYEAARRRAPAQPGERNDPPLTIVLDEAALICPVPLERWTADSRGLGITVHCAFQSRGQIRDRWGRNGADTIWDNCTALILGGLKNDDHLESLSKLTGQKRVREETGSKGPGPNGTTATTSWRMVKEPTMSVSDIMGLEPGQVLVIRRHIGVLVAKYEMVWARKDIKQLDKADKKAARAALKARKRKTVAAPNPADLWDAPPAMPQASPWGPASAAPAATAWEQAPAAFEEPWAPPAPAASHSPWTVDPAASGWAASGGFPGPRDHLRVVPGEVVDLQPQPAPVPEKPAFEPTVHLEKIPQPPAPVEEKQDDDVQDAIPPRRTRNLGAF